MREDDKKRAEVCLVELGVPLTSRNVEVLASQFAAVREKTILRARNAFIACSMSILRGFNASPEV